MVAIAVLWLDRESATLMSIDGFSYIRSHARTPLPLDRKCSKLRLWLLKDRQKAVPTTRGIISCIINHLHLSLDPQPPPPPQKRNHLSHGQNRRYPFPSVQCYAMIFETNGDT